MADRRDRAARAAAGEGRDGERDLVGILMAQLQDDPAGFDPQRLTLLHRSELKRLLDMVGASGPPVSEAFDPEPAGDVVRAGSNWRVLRRSEASSWIGDVGMGVASGCSILGLALIASLVIF